MKIDWEDMWAKVQESEKPGPGTFEFVETLIGQVVIARAILDGADPHDW